MRKNLNRDHSLFYLNNDLKKVMPEGESFSLTVGIDDIGNRLDRCVAAYLDGCSRNRVGDLIRSGCVRVNNTQKKSSYCVKPGDDITGRIPPPETIDLQPEPLNIEILYEDKDIIVVNKAAGMVVHPAPGHMSGTMANALLYHCPDIQGTGGETRPGIVHRLDKDTSGVIVVAKNQNAHIKLSRQFEKRTIHKEYMTIVYGDVKPDAGRIERPIGRHPADRTRMAVIDGEKGRHALTFWQVKRRFEGLTMLAVILKTGRTHQIRVHCASMHHPIVGDTVYGSSKVFRNFKTRPQILTSLKATKRQMLHAHRMTLDHPVSGASLSFEAPLPEDMTDLLGVLHKPETLSSAEAVC